ncbi:hypothetical protein [Sphingomonas sp. LHG3406-1]|nr:hypothetical protein [Sphingomonas sp. LHG3406-1]
MTVQRPRRAAIAAVDADAGPETGKVAGGSDMLGGHGACFYAR